MRFFKNITAMERNALFIILEGIAFTVVLNIYNPFTQMFAKRMGAGDFHIAMINSLPPLVAVFVLIPCSILIERANRKKYITSMMILINSIFYLVIAFLPFIPGRIKVIAYIVFLGLMNWPGCLYITTWQSFFADIFSGSNANRIYSLRSKYSAVFGLLAVLLSGLVLTELPRNDNERILAYQAFYLACFAISLFQLFFLSKVEQVNRNDAQKAATEPVRYSSFKEPFRNNGFMVFCLCTFLFHVSWQMGWPLFFLYNVDYAGLNEFQLSMINVVSGAVQFLSYSLWNRLVEKKGTRLAIIIGPLGLALNPLFYCIGQLSFWPIILVNALGGFSTAGFSYTLFCSLLETLPENKKTIYISLFNTFTNVSGFVSPFIGVWLYRLTGIYVAMFIVGMARLAATSLYIIRWWTGRDRNLVENNSININS